MVTAETMTAQELIDLARARGLTPILRINAEGEVVGGKALAFGGPADEARAFLNEYRDAIKNLWWDMVATLATEEALEAGEPPDRAERLGFARAFKAKELLDLKGEDRAPEVVEQFTALLNDAMEAYVRHGWGVGWAWYHSLRLTGDPAKNRKARRWVLRGWAYLGPRDYWALRAFILEVAIQVGAQVPNPGGWGGAGSPSTLWVSLKPLRDILSKLKDESPGEVGGG